MQVAVDTSILVALLNSRDLWHETALSVQQALLDQQATVVYFDCVVAEAVSTVARRFHDQGRVAEVQGALDRLEALLPYDVLTWLMPDLPRLYLQVLDLVRASSGALNFNDAFVALACRERNIPFIASFDTDFDQVVWLKRVATSSDIRTSS